MYLTPKSDPSCLKLDIDLDDEFLDFLCIIQRLLHWIATTWTRLVTAIPLPTSIWHWLRWAFSWQTLGNLIHNIFIRPSEWPVQWFHTAKWFFLTHPHVVHIVSLSIFFGPIAILLPILLFQELLMGIVFNLIFIFHGLLPGSAKDHYTALHSALDQLRGPIGSSVDSLSTKYNKFTTEFWPLILVRLFALGLGGFALYHVLSDKQWWENI